MKEMSGLRLYAAISEIREYVMNMLDYIGLPNNTYATKHSYYQAMKRMIELSFNIESVHFDKDSIRDILRQGFSVDDIKQVIDEFVELMIRTKEINKSILDYINNKEGN